MILNQQLKEISKWNTSISLISYTAQVQEQ